MHLVPDIGKIPLADALLIEDPSDHGVNDDDGKLSTHFNNCVTLFLLCVWAARLIR